jgi:hypothetical protein
MVVNTVVLQNLIQLPPGFIVSPTPPQVGTAAQSRQVQGDIAGTAQRFGLILNMDHGNRRFRRYPGNIPPVIDIEDNIPDHDNATISKIVTRDHNRLP